MEHAAAHGRDPTDQGTGLMESALIVEVPEVEPVVEQWREFLDPMSLVGIPAHITILYPFVDRVTSKLLGSIRDFAESVPVFDFTLDTVGVWPHVIYLAPTPATPFLELTRGAMQRWPSARPYKGEFPDIVPHLTVAHTDDPHLAGVITEGLRSHLPVMARADTISLWVTDGRSWTAHTTFALGAPGLS
jgi:2'-5' RNA ligase